MLKNWTKLLPFIVVEWYAKRNCEIMRIQGRNFVHPYSGTLIQKD